MKRLFIVSLFILILAVTYGIQLYGNNTDEEEAHFFLLRYDVRMSELCRNSKLASWLYYTNITDATKKHKVNVGMEEAKYTKTIWPNVTSFAWPHFKDNVTRRQLKILSTIDFAALSTADLAKLKNVEANMSSIYSTATICDFKNPNNCSLRLNPEITNIMATSNDYEELLHVWKEWHEKSGRPLRKYFPIYVSLSNKAAQLNGFNNTGLLWLNYYESDTFRDEIEKIWQQVKPLYGQIHAYVRRKLIKKYENRIREDGPIPAHILGDMWAQEWQKIKSFLIPFPNKPPLDVTKEMLRKNVSTLDLFKMAEKFFTSLGLEPMPRSFWTNSMFERPKDRTVDCHPSAWDFCDQTDVRIKMCATVNNEDFKIIHHEMGHIQYYLQYKNQSIIFREGANPGFHEAIGDTLALSVESTKHLKKLNLIPGYKDDYETDINSLFTLGLAKIVFLPFAYVMDLWRWKVFSGEITEENYNSEWWRLRKEYQGIEAENRSEEDFDPGSKFHIAVGVEYLRYFVSHIIQFQFHKALCLEAGEYEENNPNKQLHKCDIYNNRAAGTLLKRMLQLGSSKPWPEAMKVITKGATDKMDASPLLEYFKPLEEFLRKENGEQNEFIGWKDASISSSSRITSFSILPHILWIVIIFL